MTILIIGAGIAGATLGVALGKYGVPFELIERRPAMEVAGAGVMLGPNVMAALGPIGLDEAVAARSAPIETVRLLTASGVTLSTSSYKIAGYRYPGMGLHRATLQTLLLDALPMAPRWGVTATRLEDVEGGVEVSFSDGTRGHYALVVDASGAYSKLRDALNPGFALRYAGYTCWRVVVPGHHEGGAVECWGQGRRMGAVPIGDEQTYVFLTRNAPPRAPAPFDDLASFRAEWAEFPAMAQALLAKVSDLAQLRHDDLKDGVAPRWWSPHRVLIGDAAHAVTPNMGQGAGLAIEDAACLAALLAERGCGDDALAQYEAWRRPRALWIQAQSRRIGQVGQLAHGGLRWLRDGAMRMTPDSIAGAGIKRIITDMPGVPLTR